MYFMLFVFGIIAWIIIALWPARIASRKGYSFLGFFFLSIFFWPLTLIVTLLMRPKTGAHYQAATEVD